MILAWRKSSQTQCFLKIARKIHDIVRPSKSRPSNIIVLENIFHDIPIFFCKSFNAFGVVYKVVPWFHNSSFSIPLRRVPFVMTLGGKGMSEKRTLTSLHTIDWWFVHTSWTLFFTSCITKKGLQTKLGQILHRNEQKLRVMCQTSPTPKEQNKLFKYKSTFCTFNAGKMGDTSRKVDFVCLQDYKDPKKCFSNLNLQSKVLHFCPKLRFNSSMLYLFVIWVSTCYDAQCQTRLGWWWITYWEVL